MTGNVPFMMKDVVLLAVSLYPPETGRGSPDAPMRWHSAEAMHRRRASRSAGDCASRSQSQAFN